MSPIRHLRRLAGVLAGLACSWLGLAVAAPAAFAMRYPSPPPAGNVTPLPEPPGWNKHPPVPVQIHTVVVGGMPGWQIALIAAGASLLAASVAVLAYRAWTAHRRPVAAAA